MLNKFSTKIGTITLKPEATKEQPEVINSQTKKRIRLSVLVAHILLLGVPLSVITIISWMKPKTEELLVIDLMEDVLIPNELPYDENTPDEPVPDEPEVVIPDEPEVVIPDEPEVPTPPEVEITEPTRPVPNMAALPMQPTVVDTSWVQPVADKIEKPKPPEVVVTPPKNEEKPKIDQPKVDTKPNFKAISPSELASRTQKQNPNAVNEPTKPVGGTAAQDAKFKLALKNIVEIKWENDYKPTSIQMAGQKGSVVISLDISVAGKCRSATIKSSSPIPAMNTAAKELCTNLLKTTMPKPASDIVIDIELEIK